jgi:serine/threonine protein kinase
MIAMNSALPDIVVDTKLDVEVHPQFTIHFEREDDDIASRPEKHQEKWERTRRIGNGGFGAVWLQTCISGRSHGKCRAVKEIQRQGAGSPSSKLIRELEATGRFSQKRVRCIRASPIAIGFDMLIDWLI